MSLSKTQNNNSGNSSTNDNKKKENSNNFQFEPSKYRANLEEIKNKNLNTPDMLLASANNIIRPEDSIIYNPKNVHFYSNKYPVYPLRLKQDFLEKFEEDTLFFMFFEQSDKEVKEMARKELNRRGWMLSSKFKTFWKLIGEPKSQTDEYIEGDFQYFDNEKEWTSKNFNNFKFDRKYEIK